MNLSVSAVAKFIILVYFLAMPFTHAYALHRWLPLPLLVLLVGMFFLFISFALQPLKYYNKTFDMNDLWILIFLMWVMLSLLLTAQTEQKNINHIMGLFTVVAIYYFFVKFLFSFINEPHGQPYHLKILFYSVFLTSIFVCLEFADVNFINLNLKNILTYPEDIQEYLPLYAGTFYRARGFTSESGNLALFLNIFSPLIAAYFIVKKHHAYLFAFLVLYVAALIFSFSAAGIFFIFFGIAISLIIHLFDFKKIGSFVKTTFFILFIALLMSFVLAVIPEQYILPIKYKVTFSGTSSGEDRLNRWADSIESIEQNPFIGTGIGSTSREHGTGVVSLYLLLLKETGGIGFVLFVCFVVSIFYKILRMPKTFGYKYAYIISFVAGVGHYSVISDFWLPWIWLLFSMIFYDYSILKRKAMINPI